MTTTYLKPLLGYDDALDVFGVHAVGGMCGALATGFLASDTINSNLDTVPKMKDLCDWSKGHLLYVEQLKVIAFTIAISVIGTAVIGFALKAIMGLRPTPEQGRGWSRPQRSRRGGLYPLRKRSVYCGAPGPINGALLNTNTKII